MTRIKKAIQNPLVVCILLSVTAIFPFFFIGESRAEGCCGGRMPVTHDLVSHYNQMQSFYKGLAAGRLYPRWHAEAHQGYGAPATIFYPPAIYYLTSSVFFIVGDWMMVVRLVYIITMIGSGLTFYALARSKLTRRAALIAMIAYQVAPYHLINYYQRGALAECLGLVWMALVLRFVIDDRRTRLETFIGFSLSWSLFLWSHPPTAFQSLLVFGPALLINAASTRTWRRLAEVACGVIVGTLLSASYLLPAFNEQHLIHSSDVELTWPYAQSYVFDFTSQIYDHAGDEFVARIDHIWLFNLAALAVLGAWAFKVRAKRALVWVGAGFWSLFLMTSLSRPLNWLIPAIEIGVFSWRMLAMTSVCVAMLIGLTAESADFAQIYRRLGFALAILLIFANLGFSIYSVVWPMYRAEAFVPNPQHSHYALLPINARREVPDRPELIFLTGRGTAQVEKWEPEWRSAWLDVTEAGTVGLRTFFFPGWIAKVDDQTVTIRGGAVAEIVVDVPEGSHRLTLEFRPTAVRSVGSAISILTLMLVMTGAIYIAHLKLRRRHESATIKN